MKTILATTDFSANADNAVLYAADFANMIDASLHILHVYSIPIPVSEAPIPAVDISQIEKDVWNQLKKTKDKISDHIASHLNVEMAVRSGNVNWEIQDYCKNIQPYAVVMGAESNGPLERAFFGAKTLHAVSNLEWPVIVVPPDISFRNLQKIGLACDFRNVLDTVPVNDIRGLVNQFNAELHVLHVSLNNGEKMNAETIEESAWLQDLLGDLQPKYHFLHDKNAALAVARFADEQRLDLLIVLPKKHGFLEKIFEHSNSKSLVLHSNIPVMAIHE